ncbi:hypothetical protein Ae168Ps1_5293 [Pseudonocardia sp. Ae168_Ps1]|uniref:hypothetical protein n=1 Tax=unclassified Pseudonocardia TaxID=2619320 RepID=UPI0006CB7ADE|nr:MULTISPECIES: hypothetical protein [unclassified Pseudonocardia]ALE74357.1 hypothetical protein FRP1_17655 [Pseudonocardia sp. EC080625-04]ALL77766.1 hypothetical protein AD006_25110 [Pseudonocardia sp. EC080610-09]OLL76873.1 hypothetical protein Ae150APs1_5251 [Pseudonocardia sp. Ae150A_Ps1]OLL82887.1 hypothetical protein Ae168Ps1_5293 [Pseudonocardia sp. Ae168_Ps1]OLL83001.1 hypothetical protein Ae263Ps1_0056c [Pseudonocardia sp. Ae263_Ps1]
MIDAPVTTAVITAGGPPVADVADRFTTSLTGTRPTRMTTATGSTDLVAVARDADVLVVAAVVRDGELPVDLTRALERRSGTRPAAGVAFALCVAEPSDHTVVEWQLRPALVAAGLVCPTPGLTLPPRQDPGPAISAVCRYWRFTVPGPVEQARRARRAAA